MDLVAFLSPVPWASFPALRGKGAAALWKEDWIPRQSQPAEELCWRTPGSHSLGQETSQAGTGTGVDVTELILELYYFSWFILTRAKSMLILYTELLCKRASVGVQGNFEGKSLGIWSGAVADTKTAQPWNWEWWWRGAEETAMSGIGYCVLVFQEKKL